MDIEPYNKPLVNSLFGSNKKDVRIANKPNKNKITAAIIFNASSSPSKATLANSGDIIPP